MRQGSDRPDISDRLNGAHAEGDYDALADLFLGEAPVATHPTHTESKATRAPIMIDASVAEAGLGLPHGPCCSRVGPIGGAATAKPASRRIDVLVLGHLPGMGGTWAVQHARTAALQLHAPTCLLRLSGGQLVVDLIWPDDARPPEFPACDDATAALRLAAQYAGAWLVRIQGEDESLLDEWLSQPAPTNSNDGAVDRVRLLTGADDASVVAAYRRLKMWHAVSPSGFARLARVTLVEPDAARAADAEARLRKAAASFLETQLAPAERLGAMRPVRVTTLYCGPCDSSVGQMLALTRKVSCEVALVSRTASEAAPASPNRATVKATAGNDAPAPSPSAAHGAAPVGNGPHTDATQMRTTGPRTAQGSIGSAPIAQAPTVDQVVAMIARSAGVDTLRAAPTHCPWAPSIVIAIDHQGEAHAIAYARDEAHVALAAVDLLTASRWCAEHASLLAMAGVTPRATDTTLHLLTTAPAAARRLADTGLRVHAAVRVGESWGAVALS